MKTTKVSEATNIQLDWMVAKSLGWLTYPTDSIERGQWYHTNPETAPFGHEHNRVHYSCYTPSTDWAQGGPIIDREKIAVDYDHDVWNAAKYGLDWYVGGPTPLIAAMRCFVLSKLGDGVEVPADL